MITINKRGNFTIPNDEVIIGSVGDNLATTREFYIDGATDSNAVYRMYLLFDDGTSNFFILDKNVSTQGTTLIWNVKSEQIYKSGIVTIQIKGFNSDGKITHTSVGYMVVQGSVEFGESYNDKNNYEFLQQEIKLNEMLEKVEQLNQLAEENYEKIIDATSIDSEPTKDSTKPVSSGGVYTCLNAVLKDANDQVKENNLAENSVTTSKIMDKNVTFNKLDKEGMMDLSDNSGNSWTYASDSHIPTTKTVKSFITEHLESYYNKNDVNDLISKINQFKIVVADALPTENIDTNTIYLVPNNDVGNDNFYNEYLYLGNKGAFEWELIGTTKTDLSDYWSKTATQDYIDSYVFNSDNIKDNAVIASKIASNSITTGKIADNAITADKIADGSIGTKKLSVNVELTSNKVDSIDAPTETQYPNNYAVWNFVKPVREIAEKVDGYFNVKKCYLNRESFPEKNVGCWMVSSVDGSIYSSSSDSNSRYLRISMNAGTYALGNINGKYSFVMDKNGNTARLGDGIGSYVVTKNNDFTLYITVGVSEYYYSKFMLVDGDVLPDVYQQVGIYSIDTVPELENIKKIPRVTSITVKKDGTGDFTGVASAVNSITDSTVNNRYEIHIYCGEYDVIAELVELNSSFLSDTNMKGLILPDYVDLIGHDGAVLNGVLTDSTDVDTSKIATLIVNCNNKIENITITSTGILCPVYSVNTTGCNQEFKNCKIANSDTSGTAYKCTVIGGSVYGFDGCVFKATTPFSATGESIAKSAFIKHNGSVFVGENSAVINQGSNNTCNSTAVFSGCYFGGNNPTVVKAGESDASVWDMYVS